MKSANWKLQNGYQQSAISGQSPQGQEELW